MHQCTWILACFSLFLGAYTLELPNRYPASLAKGTVIPSADSLVDDVEKWSKTF